MCSHNRRREKDGDVGWGLYRMYALTGPLGEYILLGVQEVVTHFTKYSYIMKWVTTSWTHRTIILDEGQLPNICRNNEGGNSRFTFFLLFTLYAQNFSTPPPPPPPPV